MNTPDTTASAADLDAVRLSAKNRVEQILFDAHALETFADYLRRNTTVRGRLGMATLIERSAANLRQLVE